jgi:hypothetical protein
MIPIEKSRRTPFPEKEKGDAHEWHLLRQQASDTPSLARSAGEGWGGGKPDRTPIPTFPRKRGKEA